MTMANSTVASPMRSGASLRKTNKPLMEKRRRARINDSLTQLKSLVITGTKKDSSQFNKLEKADILELTVKHLRNLQNHQQHQQQQQQQQHQLAGGESGVGPRYQDGFMECANEVIRYLGNAQGFNDDTKCRVINHLASCLQLANTKDKVMQASALSAQPAAPMNTGAPTATVLSGGLIAPPTAVSAQGQIIQIVSGPPPVVAPAGKSQNVHILPSPPTATVLGSNNITMTTAHSNHQSGRAATISISGQQIAAAAAAASSHYSQPLHIHIPPAAFSPMLVGKAENIPASVVRHSHKQQHQQQQQHQPMDIASKSPARSVSSILPPGAYKVQQHQAAECSVMTTTPDSTPSPSQARFPSPPVTSRQQQHPLDTPITHVHKIHGFYSSAEDYAQSRPRTYSMASSSSSTSSSSSSSSSSSAAENELPSPLNLSSQSPTSYTIPARRMNKGGDLVPKPRHFMDKNNNINGNNNSNSNCDFFNQKLSNYSTDQENMNTSGIPNLNSAAYRLESYSPSQPFSSVALNSRGKSSPDSGPALKYMSMMMEEDGQCTRNHGHRSRSTSPASSLGEDRLWRPW